MRRAGGADVGEALTRAEEARLQVRRIGENRHQFAGMIRARPSGIAAMVGCDDQKIAGF